jgi:hypothetical protein
MSKTQLRDFIRGIWDIVKRSVGLAMVAFAPGAGIGAAVPGGSWLLGGGIAFGSVFLVVMMVLGTELASTSSITPEGIDSAFKQAVTKAQEQQKK